MPAKVIYYLHIGTKTFYCFFNATNLTDKIMLSIGTTKRNNQNVKRQAHNNKNIIITNDTIEYKNKIIPKLNLTCLFLMNNKNETIIKPMLMKNNESKNSLYS